MAPVRERDAGGHGGGLQHEEPCFGVSSACRASIGAIPPVWWCPRRGASSTVYLSWRKSPCLVGVLQHEEPCFGVSSACCL